MATATQKLLLRGRVVTMNSRQDILANGLVAIDSGEIKRVCVTKSDLPDSFASIPEIRTDGTIYPGLIDLHNHLEYNALPMWDVPRQYTNRSQWRVEADYISRIRMPIRVLRSVSETSNAIVRYAETRALLGGATTVQGMGGKIVGGEATFGGIVRNVEMPLRARLPEAEARISDLWLKGHDKNDRIRRFRQILDVTGQRGAGFFYHLSEGVDESARQHLVNLEKHDLILEPLVGIHSLALTASDLSSMHEAGAKVVWSPFSNLLLYGKTLNLNALRDSKVTFALGCDWGPTGSKNILQELKTASRENVRQGRPFTSRELVESVTASAAEVVGWGKGVGTIEEGKLADLVVTDGLAGDPYENLIDAVERNVRLVLVNGIARHGDLCLMNRLHGNSSGDLETIQIDGVAKGLYLRDAKSTINHLSLSVATATLKAAMSNLREYAEAIDDDQTRLHVLDVDGSQGRASDWKHEYEFLLDPFLDIQFDGAAAAIAEHEMVESLELEEIVVDNNETMYWRKLKGQRNLPHYVKTHLQSVYGVPTSRVK